MKTALVIPTLDAVKRGVWKEVLTAVAQQDIRLDARIVVDSSSTDQTVPIAEVYGWKVLRIKRRNFDHGATRAKIVRCLQWRGYDTVIFLSQDVILSFPGALKKLVDYLWSNDIVGCYGKQLSMHEHSLDAWQRERCYPNFSHTKRLKDVPRLQLLTPFCSNAFSAWKVASVVKLGGFPKTMFGEDMLLAAKILNSGGAIGYCANAIAVHEHSCAPWNLFLRGKAIGCFHREHPELLEQFGKPAAPFKRKDFIYIALPFAVKSFGYLYGHVREKVVPWLFFLLFWVLLLPAIILYDFPLRDVADRYAPMAEAFAAGDWQFAFHPRVTPLMPMLAGVIVRIFSFDGHLACKLAGAVMLTCGVFPLYWGCKRMYGFIIAVWTVVMYIGCSYIFRFGYYGIREGGAVFGLLLLFWAAAKLSRHPEKWGGYLGVVFAEVILLTVRGDLALFAAAAFVVFAIWDLITHRHPLRTLGAAALTLLMMSPLLSYNYRMIGYPVAEFRQGIALRAVCRKFPKLAFLSNPRPRLKLENGMGREEFDE